MDIDAIRLKRDDNLILSNQGQSIIKVFHYSNKDTQPKRNSTGVMDSTMRLEHLIILSIRGTEDNQRAESSPTTTFCWRMGATI